MKRKISIVVLVAVMMLELVGCGKDSGLDVEEANQIQVDEEISADLVYESRMELEYATEYAVDYYSDGYDLITISDGSRFLIVPEDKEVPEDLDEDIKAVQQPIDNIYLVASAAMDMFRSIEALDRVKFTGTDQDGWYLPQIPQLMEQGDIIYAGKYNAPDYELILSEGCDFVIENMMINHTPEVKEKLENFGIPVMIDRASYEEHPLGRCEWVKLYGVLTGREEQAKTAFDEQAAELERVLTDEEQNKTQQAPAVAFFYLTSNGAVNVRKTSDYVPKMIELAGGKYIFDNLGDAQNKSSSVTMQMEEFYASAKDADCLIYNSTIEGQITSIDELVAKNQLLADFKAVQSGKVWCTTQNMYQESMSIGSMIADMHAAFMTDASQKADTRYLFQLN